VVNVDSVMIAGQWKKRAGELLYPLLKEKKLALKESGQRIIAGMGLSTSKHI
jgi:hypothetical protein